MDEFKIVRAERTQARLRLALQAPSGGGKTATSLLIAKGMVGALQARGKLPTHLDGVFIGLLDTERDSAKLYSHVVPFDTLVLEPPYSPARYLGALHALERVGYPIIIADQITHEWYGQGGVLSMVANSKEYNDFARWNGPSQEHDAFMDGLLQSPAHLIVTMRSKTAWVLEDRVGKDGKTRKTPTRVGMAAKQRDGTEYEFTTLLDLAVPSNEVTCLKDRTELFTVGERYGRMGPAWGEKLIEWVYSAKAVEAGPPAPSPAMRALAVCESGIRAIERSPNIPDLQIAFQAAQKALRACSVDAGADAVVPLLERLVDAKDLRKDALRPLPGKDPAIVRDLEPGEVDGRPDDAGAPSPLDMARASCEKIAGARPGLFSTMPDDIPW
jgi:hypothetical protein